jgi:hypothetical protein
MKYILKNKEIELTDEEVREIAKQSQIKKEEERRFEIKNRYTGNIIYSSAKTNYKDVLEEAVVKEANLSVADLREAELQNAKLYGKGGTTRIKRNQIDDFLKALGVVVRE